MGETITVKDVPDIAEVVYLAKIVEVEHYEGKFKPALKFFFLIRIGKRGEGPITGMFPMEATIKNKTGILLKAALGICEVGQHYNTEQLIGKKVWVYVERKETDEGIFSRVKKAIWPPPNTAVVEPPSPAPRAEVKPGPSEWEENTVPDNMPF